MHAVARLRTSVERFRALSAGCYVASLTGVDARDKLRALRDTQRWLAGDEAAELLDRARVDGLSSDSHAALAAHVLRAAVELEYRPARAATAQWSLAAVDVESERMTVGAAVREWAASRTASRRVSLLAALDRAADVCLDETEPALRSADHCAGGWLGRVKPSRHADAGPEGGISAHCERFLVATEDLAREGLSRLRREVDGDVADGADATLFVWRAPAFDGLFRRQSRMRRLASAFEPLGLAARLSRTARLVAPHAGPFPAPELLLRAAPHDIALSPSALEFGALSELSAAESVGRMLALSLVSPALPIELRHPTVATVARAIGVLRCAWLTDVGFVARAYDVTNAEARRVALLTATHLVLEARLSAAQVLARGEPSREVRAALARRALVCELPVGLAALSVTRLSAGGPARARLLAFGLYAALRERYDEDWYRNRRAAEPLEGAAARGGTFSVEGFASELGADIDSGVRWLRELF